MNYEASHSAVWRSHFCLLARLKYVYLVILSSLPKLRSSTSCRWPIVRYTFPEQEFELCCCCLLAQQLKQALKTQVCSLFSNQQAANKSTGRALQSSASPVPLLDYPAAFTIYYSPSQHLSISAFLPSQNAQTNMQDLAAQRSLARTCPSHRII